MAQPLDHPKLKEVRTKVNASKKDTPASPSSADEVRNLFLPNVGKLVASASQVAVFWVMEIVHGPCADWVYERSTRPCHSLPLCESRPGAATRAHLTAYDASVQLPTRSHTHQALAHKFAQAKETLDEELLAFSREAGLYVSVRQCSARVQVRVRSVQSA